MCGFWWQKQIWPIHFCYGPEHTMTKCTRTVKKKKSSECRDWTHSPCCHGNIDDNMSGSYWLRWSTVWKLSAREVDYLADHSSPSRWRTRLHRGCYYLSVGHRIFWMWIHVLPQCKAAIGSKFKTTRKRKPWQMWLESGLTTIYIRSLENLTRFTYVLRSVAFH